MKNLQSFSKDEEVAHKLSRFSKIEADRRELLHIIVNSAPEDLQTDAQLNTYFSLDKDKPKNRQAAWLGGARAYASLAIIIVLVFGGGGIMWLGLTRQSSTNSSEQFSASQLQANGKLTNAVNSITQETTDESSAILSSQTENTDATDTQLQQMQESINAKF